VLLTSASLPTSNLYHCSSLCPPFNSRRLHSPTLLNRLFLTWCSLKVLDHRTVDIASINRLSQHNETTLLQSLSSAPSQFDPLCYSETRGRFLSNTPRPSLILVHGGCTTETADAVACLYLPNLSTDDSRWANFSSETSISWIFIT
jgi:hypothetical protein